MAITTKSEAVRVPEQSVESSASAVEWAAIVGGALGAVGISIILFTLGSGLGLSTVSPWSWSNPSPTTFGMVAGIWLIVTQWLASALGGYLTGRLRTKWVGIRTDEVFFRDTAHGFLAWALATVLVATFFALAASAVATCSRSHCQCGNGVGRGRRTGAESRGRLLRVHCAFSPGRCFHWLRGWCARWLPSGRSLSPVAVTRLRAVRFGSLAELLPVSFYVCTTPKADMVSVSLDVR